MAVGGNDIHVLSVFAHLGNDLALNGDKVERMAAGGKLIPVHVDGGKGGRASCAAQVAPLEGEKAVVDVWLSNGLDSITDAKRLDAGGENANTLEAFLEDGHVARKIVGNDPLNANAWRVVFHVVRLEDFVHGR